MPKKRLRLDPNYAEAWGTLIQLWRGYAASDATEDEIDRAYASARIAAKKAFALDPNSVDALVAMFGSGVDPRLRLSLPLRNMRVARSNSRPAT